MADLQAYWEEDDDFAARGRGADDDDTDDDDTHGGGGKESKRVGLGDLDARGTFRARVLGAEDVPTDSQALVLGGELVNCVVERQKLAENKLMRFVTKIASSAPAKGREKRQMVLTASAEFPPGGTLPPPGGDFVEVGKTDMSYDDPHSTFALPVRVLCRQGMDRLVRVQVVWSQSNVVMGGESTVLGQYVERFSELLRKTANFQPVDFPMTSAACPPGSRAVLWRLPFASLRPPCTPYVEMAARKHVSYTVPYLFRRQEGGRTAAGKKGRCDSEEEEAGPDDFLLARETALEARFSYRLAALIFAPFVTELETAVAGWKQRYEYERIAQGFFASDAEALQHGRVLVRLSVVEAKELPLLKEDAAATECYAGFGAGKGKGGGGGLAQKAQKLAARSGNKAAQEKVNATPCHPFVAVTLDKPTPQEMGVLVGHTNTEYGTQAPVFGSGATVKLCPHGRPREHFGAQGAARLRQPPHSGLQHPAPLPSFLFYAHKEEDVDKASLRFEVFYETERAGSAQFTASARLLLDSKYLKGGAMEDSPHATGDTEAWLPLLDKEGNAAGRLLVRVAIFASANASSSVVSPASAGAAAPDFLAPPLLEETEGPSAPPPLEVIQRSCYEWMKQAGFSAKPPREGDVFDSNDDGVAETPTTKVQPRYPLEWIRRHMDSLTQELQVLQASLRLWEQAANDGRGFRSSEHKMTEELQGVPTNVHSQTFVVADLRGTGDDSAPSSSASSVGPVQDLLPGLSTTATTSSSATTKHFYYDLVSTGAPTAHALGFRRGGLLSHHMEMATLQKEMVALDQALLQHAGPNLVPTGPTGELYNELLAKLLTFEAMAAKTAIRRALVLSQALGIATTSLATKLDIMLTEDADQSLVTRTAENMTKAGFLVCFQGLVSTIGKEHGMLEDVAMAMEMASTFNFEIRPKSVSQHARNPTPLLHDPTSPHAQDLLMDLGMQLASGAAAAAPASGSPRASRGVSPRAGAASKALEIEFDEVHRRVRLLLDLAAYERLPRVLRHHGQQQQHQQGVGVVVPLVAVLFAQGIDAKQTLANFSNQLKKDKDKDDSGDEKPASKKVGGDSTIQPLINRRSTKVLNDYCHRCYPFLDPATHPPFDRVREERLDLARGALVYGSAEEFARSVDELPVHPLCESLKEALKRDNGMHKNVDLLREQERVNLEVGGGQVIFCKSGKVRGGMNECLDLYWRGMGG